MATLTITNMLAEAERLLRGTGYKVVRGDEGLALSRDQSLLAEDRYGVVGIIAYETWRGLVSGWTEAQGALVNAMSERMTRSEPKTWDGYLVCLTLAPTGPIDEETANEIRRNTVRVRKLVATGNELRTLKDVQRVLLPLMPLEPERIKPEAGLFARLPEILERRGIERDASGTLLDAFRKREPLLERLHDYLDER